MKREPATWLSGLLAGLGVVLIGYLDYLTGYELNFFVFYFLPVASGAWLAGTNAALTISILSALVWFAADTLSGHNQPSQFYAVWETVIRLVSFLAIGLSVAKIRQLLERERLIAAELRTALSQLKVLEGFIPICCQCKKIRKEDNSWQQLEAYLSERSNASFTHGYCPDCARKVLEEAGLDHR